MAAILNFCVSSKVKIDISFAKNNPLTPKTPYMNVSLQKCDQPQFFKIYSFTLAAILKSGAKKKFRPHVSEVHR